MRTIHQLKAPLSHTRFLFVFEETPLKVLCNTRIKTSHLHFMPLKFTMEGEVSSQVLYTVAEIIAKILSWWKLMEFIMRFLFMTCPSSLSWLEASICTAEVSLSRTWIHSQRKGLFWTKFNVNKNLTQQSFIWQTKMQVLFPAWMVSAFNSQNLHQQIIACW